MNEQLVTAMADMQEEEALQMVHTLLDTGEDPQAILDAATEAMAIVGKRFDEKEYFLPELIIAGDMMKSVGELVKPRLQTQAASARIRGKVVIGTVAGDIHDIGKDIVSFMLDVNGFAVVDLGVDVPAAAFVAKIQEEQPEIVGLSGFLTLAFEQMKRTVDAIQAAGLRDKVKVMIGGAIMDASAAQFVGADAYGANASVAVKLAESWVA